MLCASEIVSVSLSALPVVQPILQAHALCLPAMADLLSQAAV